MSVFLLTQGPSFHGIRCSWRTNITITTTTIATTTIAITTTIAAIGTRIGDGFNVEHHRVDGGFTIVKRPKRMQNAD